MNDINEKISFIDYEIREKGYFSLSTEFIQNLSMSEVEQIVPLFVDKYLIKLPPQEIEFFEWVRANDINVWNDLWVDDEHDVPPYLVSFVFLPILLEPHRGFPICDLLQNPNYYFSSAHLIGENADLLLESASERASQKQSLTTAQLLALEISIAPIDVWRFAYNHQLNLQACKNAVQALVDDKVLVHLTEAEQLANFVELLPHSSEANE